MTLIGEKQKAARRDSQQADPEPVERPRTNEVAEALVSQGFLVPDLEAANDAPPAYGEHLDQVQFSQPGFEAGAVVTDSGRVNINIHTKDRKLADLLAPTLARQISDAQHEAPLPPAYIPPSLGGQPGQTPPPQLNVVIQIVGSRGDVQPFVALGKILKDTYGHRVRVATHPTFQAFVEENGLEFFSIGGDPAELMAFMVKYPGLMPGFDAVKSGEVSRRRQGIAQMLIGCWRSCIEAGDGLGPPPKPHSKAQPLDLSQGMPGDQSKEPFVADAIIANPPSFAHIHVAEKLGIPLHMMFTMPWSLTRAFPHPLANIQSSNADDVMTNYLSYTLVEMMTWQGLGDIINRFREKALDLSPLSLVWAPGLLGRLRIPYTYCWSPALIPKPNDWGNNVDVSGFYFLNLASSYTPDPALDAFLKDGPPPVYIGFGSIVVEDPNAMTRMIFDAVNLAGVRALVSKGWGGLGAEDVGLPEGVFMLGNVPHDWLFQHVSAVVHHGGAGTTAAGIKAGKPTLVVPFFGDQPFWGAMIAKANAGPDPIPFAALTAEKLAEGLKFCLKPETLDRAQALGHRIREEKGTDVGGQSFHDHLDMDSLRCSVAPSRTAVWQVRKTKMRLSPLAAAVLVEEGILQYTDLKLYRSTEHNTEDQPPDPISAATSSLVMDMTNIGMAIADMPTNMFKTRRQQRPATAGDGPSKPSDAPSDGASKGASDTVMSPGAADSTHDVAASQRTVPAQSSASEASLAGTSSVAPSAKEGSSSSSRPPLNPEPVQRQSTTAEMKMEAAVGAGKGVGRIVSTGVKSPMNFCLSLAKGFRNVPKAYNDDTVRPIEKVTDFSSGVRVASKEFGYGVMDGIAGLVTQPLRGAEKEGAQGLIKGFAKGIGGVVLKPAAGFWGVPAYMMQGVHAEVNKLFTRSVQNYIFTSRVVQGRRDLSKATAGEKKDIVARWKNADFDRRNFNQMKKKEKTEGKAPPGLPAPTDSGSEKSRAGWLNTRNLSSDERNKLNDSKDGGRTGYVDETIPTSSGNGDQFTPSSSVAGDSEFEQAIQASVKETSRGNAQEDAAVEAAIRQSVQSVRKTGGLPEPVPEKDSGVFKDSEWEITDEEYQDLIEQAIRQSLAGEDDDAHSPHQSGVTELGSRGKTHQQPADEEDEANLRRAIEASKNAHSSRGPTDDDDDDEIRRAIAASKEHMQQENTQRTEEEIVMEYVKKQSLAEEAFRKHTGSSRGQGVDADGVDEELKLAMEESLKLHTKDESGPSGTRE